MGILDLFQTDIKSVTTNLQTSHNEGVAVEKEGMFFRVQVMFIKISFGWHTIHGKFRGPFKKRALR